jgi:copper oxidase (laccase) domain-containing protein
VLEATIAALDVPPGELHAWIGPAIGAAAFEVGAEVRETFLRRSGAMEACFRPNASGRWQADLSGLARLVLAAAGVNSVHGGGWCTHDDAERFYSYRRDGVTGRMATLAWLV